MRKAWMGPWLAVAILALAGCNNNGTSTSSSPDSTNPSSSSPSAVDSVKSAIAKAVEPPKVTVPEGTSLTVTIDQAVSTKTSNSGDHFDASLAEPVTVDGKEVIAKGAKISGTVNAADSAGHIKGAGVLSLTLDSIEVHGKSYAIETSAYEQSIKSRGKRTLIGGGGGAAVGAIIGGIAGGGKGAAIGAAAGGGAGTAGAAYTGQRDITIPAETRVHFKLTKSVSVQQ